jgi:hypothetical protein
MAEPFGGMLFDGIYDACESEDLVMNSQVSIVIAAIIVIALIALAVWFYLRQYRSRRLKERFGPEYERAISAHHDRNLAEAELRHREDRVKLFRIVSLSEAERVQYEDKWVAVQGHFVDDPKTAVQEAHELILEVMEKRGYPSGDLEQTAADLSVHYPDLVPDYRAANQIADSNRRGAANTEDLRQALVHYRALFKELLTTTRSDERRREIPRQNIRPAERSQPSQSQKGGVRT